MNEPDYVPVILTTKSALFQWEAECRRFMRDMDPVVVSGEPYERQAIYESFASGGGRKKLLLITYDTVFRDADTSVIRNRGVRAPLPVRKALKSAKDAEKAARDAAESLVASLKDMTEAAGADIQEYVVARMNGREERRPSAWSDTDERALCSAASAREALLAARNEVARLTDEVAPPVKVPGVIDRLAGMRAAGSRIMLVMDEVHKVKNYRSQVHEKIKALSTLCDRIVGMTATPVKNRLMEFFGIFRIVKPDLFPRVTPFQNQFCITKMQKVGGGRQVPVVVGYKNLDAFVSRIEPFFLSRKKHDVAKELPELISVEVQCELHQLQDELYDMAEAGVGDGTDDEGEESHAEVLSSLTMCQQAVNAPQLILDDEGNPFDGTSAKVEALVDLLEGDADGRKVIVFSRFEKMVSHVEGVLKKAGIKHVRITGKESNPRVRQQARETFQDPNSGVNVIMITTAGSESLNLQAAEHFVFLDLPWSFGDYLQLIGRMIRIGSSHTTVVAHHFLAVRRDGTKTIDHHVLKALRGKKKLSDTVAGDALIGGLKLESNDTVTDVLSAIQDRNRTKAGPARATKPASSGKAGRPPAPGAGKAEKPKFVDPNGDAPVFSVYLDPSEI